MKVKREICIAGKVIDITVKVPSGNHRSKRNPKINITKEKVQKNNERLAAKNLCRLFNANCDSSWWHDTLTYEFVKSVPEAKKIFNNFKSRVKRECKKIGIEFKWIVTTEFKNKRIHHHLITNAPLDMVKKQWREGHVLPRPLDEGPNYVRLAEYIIKETKKTFREGEAPKTRYSHSRNLIIPEVKVEYVEEKMLFEDPKPWKGYFIDTDTLRRYEHPITKLEHLEYTMVSLKESPRVKRYYKGKKKAKENFNRYINSIEKQISLFDDRLV
ncbi:MAG: hypothetical protein RSB99_03445 [Bacilli bacterium]|uniref:rolling circle replication-associated protein n=1 Tax=Chryseobacterium sp. TaxID=1871047 RepID=UPI002FCC8E03